MGGRARRSEPGTADRSLRFVWWNVADFAHFDQGRSGEDRWPPDPETYQAKCERVDGVLRTLSEQGPPDVVALAEVTQQAAQDLRDRMFKGFEVHSLDEGLPRVQFQVAILYDPKVAGSPDLLVVPDVPEFTRPMAVLDIPWPGHRLRVYGCHWRNRFGEDKGQPVRDRQAEFLRGAIYDFLHEEPAEKRHVLVVGDLNEEPFTPLFEQRLLASRDRATSRRSEHHTDKDVRRVRLYNATWRLLGERLPHTPAMSGTDTAGTHYWRQERRWVTFDHVIVDGSLLTDQPPFFVETELEVVADPLLFGADRLPFKFQQTDRGPAGLSDHLPLRGRILLADEESHG
jgi:endonuclease/exonuclease/phosphatase family metal-dependent hydrolase